MENVVKLSQKQDMKLYEYNLLRYLIHILRKGKGNGNTLMY